MKHFPLLLIDDEVEYAEALAERLEMRGHTVELAFNGTNGLSLVRKNRYRIILLDLRLPEMDGCKVLAILRSEGIKTPVVIITGHGSDADRKACEEHGISGFMNKPIDFAKLNEIIKDYS